MLIAKYVACVYVYQHSRQKILRESPCIPDVSPKLATQLTLHNFAPLLKACVMAAKLSKGYCSRKCCKCYSPHTKALPSSFSCPPWPAVEIILCQLLNRAVSAHKISVGPALASELMRSQWNHSPRLFNTMFSSHLLVQIPFPIY